MQFKKFLLDDYLQTDDGKKCYKFFQNIKDIFFHDQKRFFDFVDSWLTEPEAYNFFELEQFDENLKPEAYLHRDKKILPNLRNFATLKS